MTNKGFDLVGTFYTLHPMVERDPVCQMLGLKKKLKNNAQNNTLVSDLFMSNTKRHGPVDGSRSGRGLLLEHDNRIRENETGFLGIFQ
jgi:hypothetical protein